MLQKAFNPVTDSELISYQHRVKNLLAMVRSMAARSMENSAGMEDFMMHFDGRLGALGRTQNLLGRRGLFEIDLEELLRGELLAHHAEARAEISGPEVRLKQRAAESIGLALHELTVNALTFGALSTPEGKLFIGWSLEGGDLILEWRESGVEGLKPEPPRRGFGRELIERGLPYQLNAEASLDFRPGGVLARIRIPGKHVKAETAR